MKNNSCRFLSDENTFDEIDQFLSKLGKHNIFYGHKSIVVLFEGEQDLLSGNYPYLLEVISRFKSENYHLLDVLVTMCTPKHFFEQYISIDGDKLSKFCQNLNLTTDNYNLDYYLFLEIREIC